MAKLKVTAFKKSGKFYTKETYNLEGYPTLYNCDQSITVKELIDLQVSESYRVWQEIQKGNMLCYCPVNRWEGYYFMFEGIFEDSESGFLTYMLDKTKAE